MTNIEIPHYAIAEVRNSVLPQDVSRLDMLELRVRTEDRNIIAIDLASFLELGERIYSEFDSETFSGNTRRRRSKETNLAIGAHGRQRQPYFLEIDRIEAGSLELFFLQSLSNIVNSHAYITLFLVWNALRFDRLSLSVKNLAEAYHTYQLGVSAREKRLEHGRLEDKQIQPIAHFLEQLLADDTDTLERAHRFAKRSVLDVDVRLKRT